MIQKKFDGKVQMCSCIYDLDMWVYSKDLIDFPLNAKPVWSAIDCANLACIQTLGLVKLRKFVSFTH